jgi:hypothetical protein
MGMLVIIKDWGVFQCKKIHGMELGTDKILEENFVQSRDWEINSPFSRTPTSNTRPNIHWSCLLRRHIMFITCRVTVILKSA